MDVAKGNEKLIACSIHSGAVYHGHQDGTELGLAINEGML